VCRFDNFITFIVSKCGGLKLLEPTGPEIGFTFAFFYINVLSVRVGERSVAYRILVGSPEEKHHLEDLSVDGKIILTWIFKKQNGRVMD
jgi:hypothetical protein